MDDRPQAIPSGFHGVTPHLVVPDGAAATDFQKEAFGAVEHFRMPVPDGERILHAQIQIGGCPVMLADAVPELRSKGPDASGGSAVALHLYVENVDAAHERAVKAGAEASMPPEEMSWAAKKAFSGRDPASRFRATGAERVAEYNALSQYRCRGS